MPAARVFVDANVLLYLHDRRFPEKREIARTWLTALARVQAAHINLQFLNEVSHVLLRKKWFETPATVFSVVDELAQFGDASITWAQVRLAREIVSKTGYSWWDCLLLASALELGCAHFLSEDLQDGQEIEGLTIVDPFAHSPEQILIPR